MSIMNMKMMVTIIRLDALQQLSWSHKEYQTPASVDDDDQAPSRTMGLWTDPTSSSTRPRPRERRKGY